MQRATEPTQFSRRQLMALVGVGAAGAVLAGCADGGSVDRPAERAYCVPRGAVESYRTLAGLPLVYEVNQRRSPFSFEPGFHRQLGAWLESYSAQSGVVEPDQVWTYGGWIDGGADCDSWHHSGRAFDLGRLRVPGGEFVSCRYDRWQSTTGAELDRSLRQYWSLAASLHLHFAYVLTYLYNAAHHNHIHIDNGRSGTELSTFASRSRVQVQAVQAICTYLWDQPVDITGHWDASTRRASRRALQQAGRSGDLDDSVDSWRAFLTASVGRGAD
ncbi:MAG: hypothetical protein H0T91_02265 [Propionibacteriaceae bacterium]|nr:hypothetical protein [Propionibacteriaceae bacterium]